jgi:hypothetical protein
MVNPFRPNSSTIPYMMIIKAPVGPPIWTRLPPSEAISIPAMMAVIKPFSGETPEAMAKAIARGNATIPTIIPETISFDNVSLEIPSLKIENNFGVNSVLTLDVS